jgi:hypothetical protein
MELKLIELLLKHYETYGSLITLCRYSSSSNEWKKGALQMLSMIIDELEKLPRLKRDKLHKIALIQKVLYSSTKAILKHNGDTEVLQEIIRVYEDHLAKVASDCLDELCEVFYSYAPLSYLKMYETFLEDIFETEYAEYTEYMCDEALIKTVELGYLDKFIYMQTESPHSEHFQLTDEWFGSNSFKKMFKTACRNHHGHIIDYLMSISSQYPRMNYVLSNVEVGFNSLHLPLIQHIVDNNLTYRIDSLKCLFRRLNKKADLTKEKLEYLIALDGDYRIPACVFVRLFIHSLGWSDIQKRNEIQNILLSVDDDRKITSRNVIKGITDISPTPSLDMIKHAFTLVKVIPSDVGILIADIVIYSPIYKELICDSAFGYFLSFPGVFGTLAEELRKSPYPHLKKDYFKTLCRFIDFSNNELHKYPLSFLNLFTRFNTEIRDECRLRRHIAKQKLLKRRIALRYELDNCPPLKSGKYGSQGYYRALEQWKQDC